MTISTRSGAWILPNYVSGFASDLYQCRAANVGTWKLASTILEWKINLIYGHPNIYGLNPKMRALQTQPTVSPTLIHYIQRKDIKIEPNIKVDEYIFYKITARSLYHDRVFLFVIISVLMGI